MKRTTIPGALLLVLASMAWAQNAAGTDAIDESALFGDESSTVQTPAATSPKGSAVSTFLKAEGVRIGGSFTGTLAPAWTWTDPWTGNNDPRDPDTQLLNPAVEATVFFDARPDEETRFHGSFKMAYPFSTAKTFVTGMTGVDNDSDGQIDEIYSTTDSLKYLNMTVFELFADRSWHDRLFFRFGKHTVKWGVGYFWSPADVINLTKIDVTDPTAQLEGPVNLRLNIPLPGSQDNIWAYAILPDDIAADELEPRDIAWAGKYEALLGNWEIGLGGFYQRELAPKAMLTATGAIWRFNLFGELVGSWGSDKEWVDSLSGTTVTTRTDDDGLYLSGTAGFSFVDSTDKITAYLQYFYNGDGYSDSARKALIREAQAALDTVAGTDYESALTYAYKYYIYQSGLHYAGLFFQKEEFLSTKCDLSLLAIVNLSDLSGMVQPTVSWEFFDGYSLSLNPTFYWTTTALWGEGAEGEYVILAGGPSVTISLKAKLGTDNF